MAQDEKTQHVQRLTSFIKYLVPSDIKFVFFYAENMDKPHVVTTFGKHQDWYITPGKDANYCYAYMKSNLAYMVTHMRLKQKGTIALYTAKLTRLVPGTPRKDIAYLGNHIDFSVHNEQSSGIYFKTHWTEYLSRDNAKTFERRADEVCNFKAPPSKNAFGKTQCVDRHGRPLYQLDRIFSDKKQQGIIEDLWKASTGRAVSMRGGAPRGAPPQRKSYKGMDTLRPDFFKFMNRTIFNELWDKIAHAPFYVYQYFDEGNELDPVQGNTAIQFVVEFEEGRTLAFAVSSHRALKACWADANTGQVSVREKRALARWHRACSEFLATDFYGPAS